MHGSLFIVGWYSRNTRRDHAEHVRVSTRSSVGVNTTFSVWVGIFQFRYQLWHQPELLQDNFSSGHSTRVLVMKASQTMSGHQLGTIFGTGEFVIFLFGLSEISKKSDGTRTAQESYIVEGSGDLESCAWGRENNWLRHTPHRHRGHPRNHT